MPSLTSLALLTSLLELSTAYSLGVKKIAATADDTARPVGKSFVSYSIEFSSFPEYAGNLSHPNHYSDQLLANIAALSGTKPYIRVGGNTQDYALYDPHLDVALKGTYTNASKDYPTIITIGKSYFESYQTWPSTIFSHGFNLAANSSSGFSTLRDTASLACKALKNKLYVWEMGNEPDLYKTSSQTIKRPSDWDEHDYVNEWLNRTAITFDVFKKSCPDTSFGWMAPSFAGTDFDIDLNTTWAIGLDTNKDIILNSQHHYIDGATSPGVTLRGTLMNHTRTVESVESLAEPLTDIYNTNKIPYMMGETNSLYNEGAPGLSNSFGAALWGVDYNLYLASRNFYRVHMHQGTNYRYQSWQPVSTSKTAIGTKPPYYGNIAVAASLGNLASHQVQVVNLELGGNGESYAGYLIYQDSQLKRVMLLNMNQYNATDASGKPSHKKRGSTTFSLKLPGVMPSSKLKLQRLSASGSDAITGITWDGWSYNYELKKGQPVRLHNVTVGETVSPQKNGETRVTVPDSSACLVNL